MSDHTVLQLSDASLWAGKRLLVESVSLELSVGQSVAVVGRSGSGKTTLLETAIGLRPPHSGSVAFGGTDLYRLRGAERTAVRRDHIGVVFQQNELFSDLSALDNVLIGSFLRHSTASTQERTREAERLLDTLEVPSEPRPVRDLSGGERQRAAIARALAGGPSLLVADEPTASLDADLRDSVVEMLLRACQDASAALLLVTHDPSVAASCEQVFAIQNQQWTRR